MVDNNMRSQNSDFDVAQEVMKSLGKYGLC